MFKRLFCLVIICISLISLPSCGEPIEPAGEIDNSKQEEMKIEYSITEISDFGRQRIIDLLNKHDFTDYTNVSLRRDYNYTAEDYRKIPELDDTYLYNFYVLAMPDDVQEFCKALGYEDLEDFLIKKDYLNSKGEPDIGVCYRKHKEIIASIMVDEGIIPKDNSLSS